MNTLLKAGVSGPDFSPLLTNLVSQYKLNESSGNALDSIGGYDLTQNGTSSSVAGKINTARGFDGSCYFNRTPNAAQRPADVNFSLSVWFYLGTVAAGTRQIFSYREAGSASGNIYFIVRMEAAALVLYTGTGAGGSFSNSTRATGLTTGGWYHYAMSLTFATKAVRDSLNGGTVGTWTPTHVPTLGVGAMPSPIISLGGDVLELMGSGGRIDCAKLWIGRALSDADMLLDYNSGSGVEL